MFCYQCQETKDLKGCVKSGICGKSASTAELQDLLIYNLKGIALCSEKAFEKGELDPKVSSFITKSLFKTITNGNFDDAAFISEIRTALSIKRDLRNKYFKDGTGLHDSITWEENNTDLFRTKATAISILSEKNEDIRSLKELLTYGIKGISAYLEHANNLGYHSREVEAFMIKGLAATTRGLEAAQLIDLVMECGQNAVTTMSLLDKANTETYGNPEITRVSISVGKKPGILVSGHDLRDMSDLLEQTKNAGVDVYTHCEMLPANYYPKFKKYAHLVGNYGSSWWHQNKDFESFGGPILMTTNCIIPVRDSYRNRIFTTGQAGYPGVRHIADREEGGMKDFSEIIALAKNCPPPKQIEEGEIVGGFAHNQVLSLADKIVDAVKKGAIKRFVVMAGCDGRQGSREYFTDVAKELPKDTVILTAGCAKYRYNKLPLGDISGIPRVLDAGQCNDSYSLAVTALKLKEVFGLDDINKLPISYDIAWYEQKAVAVLLALLYLGVKGIRLGPTLPAFLSPGVAKVLVENFNIKGITTPEEDVRAMMAGG
ncbi:MAG: hydroxylamine reductase [Oligoflexales bacterium]|nr:hydroxylamine reductase [Oligoflexales bacterium]